jgi:hypothetical protein
MPMRRVLGPVFESEWLTIARRWQTFLVCASKPYGVLLSTYAVLAVWLLAVPVWNFLALCWRYLTSPDWVISINPFYLAFPPYVQPGKAGALSQHDPVREK